MSKLFKNKIFIYLSLLCILGITFYGAGRIYFHLTGGFLESNITSNLEYDSRWNIHKLSEAENYALNKALDQKYHYLGKGCQSYVFVSDDDQFVIKFFKYQRFRPRTWYNFLSFIPAIESYKLKKIEQKKQKLESIFSSWKIAFDDLKNETGLVYLHLNKSKDLKRNLIVYDKLGLQHFLKLDKLEFLIQRKAELFCSKITQLMKANQEDEAKILIQRLLNLITSEYNRGIADNDHALMQNTGVLDDYPLHIDVGQFVKNVRVKNPDIFHQELFNKTYKFNIWLKEHYPSLSVYLEKQLYSFIGSKMYQMKPYLRKGSVGVLSHYSDLDCEGQF